MRAWMVLAVLVAVAVGAQGAPADMARQVMDTVRTWVDTVTTYLNSLPSKTPSDVATDVASLTNNIASDVQTTVVDLQRWVQNQEAVQNLIASIAPARQWIQKNANTIGDKSFQQLYEDVKLRVTSMEAEIAAWVQQNMAA